MALIQVIEHLPGNHEALSLNLITAKNQKNFTSFLLIGFAQSHASEHFLVLPSFLEICTVMPYFLKNILKSSFLKSYMYLCSSSTLPFLDHDRQSLQVLIPSILPKGFFTLIKINQRKVILFLPLSSRT
jgi:hypothetical protein